MDMAFTAFAYGYGAPHMSLARPGGAEHGRRIRRPHTSVVRCGVLEPAVEATVDGWLSACEPFIQVYSQNVPTSFVHWAHPIGGALLVAYVTYAAFIGWQIRAGNGARVFPFSYGQPARQRHPYAMGWVFIISVIQLLDGPVELRASEQTALQSLHFSSALLFVLAFTVLSLIGYNMDSSRLARDVHAYFGILVVLLLIVHLGFGVQLALSF